MGNSNTKIERKRIAREIDDEIFTINTETSNFVEKLKAKNFKDLQRFNLKQLKRLRGCIQDLKHSIRHANDAFDSVEQMSFSEASIEIKNKQVVVEQTNLQKYI